jgi:hypothetical protein
MGVGRLLLPPTRQSAHTTAEDRKTFTILGISRLHVDQGFLRRWDRTRAMIGHLLAGGESFEGAYWGWHQFSNKGSSADRGRVEAVLSRHHRKLEPVRGANLVEHAGEYGV